MCDKYKINIVYKNLKIIARLSSIKSLVGMILLIGISFILETISIASIFPILDIITSENYLIKYDFVFSNISFLQTYNEKELFIFLFSFFLLIFLVRTIYLIFFNFYKINFLENIRYKLSDIVVSSYLKKDFIFFSKIKSSEIIRNVISETNYIINYINQLITLITEILILLSLSLIIVFNSSPVVLYSLALFILIFFLLRFILKKSIKKYSNIRINADAQKINVLEQIINGIKEIKINKKEDFFNDYFNYQNYNTIKSSKFLKKIQSLPRFILEMLLMLILCFWIIFNLNTNNLVNTLPFIGLVVFSSVRILPSFNRIILATQGMKYGEPAIKAITELVNIKKNLFDNRQNNKIIFKDLIIKNLKFNFDKKSLIKLEDFQILKGDIIGIKGDNGSGKSTLINIMLGLINVENKKIFINGKDINLLKNQWQDIVSVTSQDPFILNENLEFNISLDKEEIDNDNLNSVLELINFDQNQNKLELFKNLSGGNKQKISIARSIYKDPQVYFFDEPTTFLDTNTINNLLKFIKNNRDKTFVIVSHDEKIIDLCNKIIDL